ncbi:hypothetical protein ACH3XW_24750 [Acanthocheilonema viteae]
MLQQREEMETHALCCSIPQQSKESLISVPSEQSSVSTRIRRMQIPTKASDVDQFLDAIFEQVLPANDLERTDDNHVNAAIITSTIKGTIANDTNETLQSTSQQCLTTTVNYAARPMMLMLPVDGRMLNANQQQQQQNHEQIYANNSLSNGTITATPISSVMPVMVPMICMSPTPTPTTTVTARLSPVSTKNSIATGNFTHMDDRTLSPVSVCYNCNTTSSSYNNGTMPSNTFANDTATSIAYANGANYSEHNDRELSGSSTTMMIRSSPLPEIAQSPTNLDQKSRVGQIQPTSAKARYVGPVHPQTNECLRSPPLSIKNLHYNMEKEQNHLQSHELGYIRNQFNPIEIDKNSFYGTATREKPYSGRSAVLSRGNNTSSPSNPCPSLRRTQPHLRSQPIPQSPSPPPRLIKIPETEFGTGTIESREIISNNNYPKLNAYSNSGMRSMNAYGSPNSDDIIHGKKSLRAIVEFENDALKNGKEKSIYGTPTTKSITVSNTINSLKNNKKQQQQQMYRSNFDSESSRSISQHHFEALQEFGEQRETLGEWINEMDEAQSHAQTMAEVAIHHGNLPKAQQQQEQKAVVPYFMQNDQQNEQQRERPAVQYARQPWNLVIRKQIFHPNEQLGEEQEIDLIFSQIISDCRKPKSYRIHNNERDGVSQILRNYRIPPAVIDNPQLIMMDVKIAVIQYARRWPLYFSVLFPVVDQFMNRVTNEVINAHRILSVHESGLTLLSQDDIEDKIGPNILDHFK